MAAMERWCDPWYERKAQRANLTSGKYAPKWTGRELRRLATGLVGAALARAQSKCGVEIVAVVVMSNHIHLVIHTPRKNCSQFMRIFKANVTRAINRITGRRGPLWARRADVQPALDENASSERTVYCADNPRKANLVSDAELWPGLTLWHGQEHTNEFLFEDFDTSAWRKAGRPSNLDPYFRTNTLRLSPPPGMDPTEREAFASAIRSKLQQHAQPSKTRSDTAPRPLGIQAILQTALEGRPKQAASSNRPYCFGSTEQKSEYFRQMTLIVAAHEASSTAFLAGNRDVEFPEGTYRPPITQAAAA